MCPLLRAYGIQTALMLFICPSHELSHAIGFLAATLLLYPPPLTAASDISDTVDGASACAASWLVL